MIIGIGLENHTSSDPIFRFIKNIVKFFGNFDNTNFFLNINKYNGTSIIIINVLILCLFNYFVNFSNISTHILIFYRLTIKHKLIFIGSNQIQYLPMCRKLKKWKSESEIRNAGFDRNWIGIGKFPSD